ncbi:amidinotransferase [Yinghuangia aomiensis]|uniref:Amidinotransferase n=1 Tax=Yinghuangia aomiensis TaxID=676205 RepID=A0ABP9I814_9ACTN
MPTDAAKPACSHDEFSPLLEVVVGTARGAYLPDPHTDRSAWLNLYGDLTADQLAGVRGGPVDPRVIEESEEDLDALADTLTALGVRVHRPAPVDHSRTHATPSWSAPGLYGYCPRDLALVVGSAIIETPSPMRARYHELDTLRHVFTGYAQAGSVWLAAPKPRLADELYPVDSVGRPVLGDGEPAFEAANVLRIGRDLLYLVSASGNEAGLRWLRSVLALAGEYTVHAVRGVYAYTHIDSTIALIRPGLVLFNPERVTEDTVPAPLRSWDRIWCPPMRDTGTPATGGRPPLSSPWIGMNLLMVNPRLAVVDAAQTDLIAALEKHGVDVLPHTLRHARTLGGGLHCVTLDTVRQGACESYVD